MASNSHAGTTTAGTSHIAVAAPPARAGLYARLALVALFWGGSFIAGRLLGLLHGSHFLNRFLNGRFDFLRRGIVVAVNDQRRRAGG